MSNAMPFLAHFARKLPAAQANPPDSKQKGNRTSPGLPPPSTTITQVNDETTDEN